MGRTGKRGVKRRGHPSGRGGLPAGDVGRSPQGVILSPGGYGNGMVTVR